MTFVSDGTTLEMIAPVMPEGWTPAVRSSPTNSRPYSSTVFEASVATRHCPVSVRFAKTPQTIFVLPISIASSMMAVHQSCLAIRLLRFVPPQVDDISGADVKDRVGGVAAPCARSDQAERAIVVDRIGHSDDRLPLAQLD